MLSELIINRLIDFPLWDDDGAPKVYLNQLQKKQIDGFLVKVKSAEYKFVKNSCLCGNKETEQDILIARKDRYGIPCDNVLCKRCGLIRLKEKLDDLSTEQFYQNEYRDIYVGCEVASDGFFKDQAKRGEVFFNLVQDKIGIDKVDKVFDIGCGAGGVLLPFFQSGKSVSGCDFGEKYLVYGQNKGLGIYRGEINIRNTAKNSQDLIILSHVMEHFNEPIEIMAEIIEYVKPGKFLLVEVPGVFDMKRTYPNPLKYFQSAHIHNYYFAYLKVFFEGLGLDVIYGDERCTFLLRKPIGWRETKEMTVDRSRLRGWADKIEYELKKNYLLHTIKLNPYYYRVCSARFCKFIGVTNIVKWMVGR